MELLERVKAKINKLGRCSAAYILAHAAWSSCDHRELPGPSLLRVSVALDPSNTELFFQLNQITTYSDYSNDDQAEMLRWLDKSGYSGYVSKQVKVTKKKLIDWV